MQKWAILGASKGLGKALALEVSTVLQNPEMLLVSRKAELLREVARNCGPSATIRSFDFTRREHQSELLTALSEFTPTHLIYVPGGTSSGSYGKRAYSAHRWTLELGFVFLTQVIHHAVTTLHDKGLQQMITVGDSRTDRDVSHDLAGASYLAAKDGVKGLIKRINLEGSPIDLRLFSSSLLSATDANQQIETQASESLRFAQSAKNLWKWSQNSKAPYHYQD